MPSSKIPSPARSLSVKSTPRRYKHRRTRSVSSPARSENSVKLTTLLPDSFVVSSLPKRRSVLTDDTDVDIPKRQSWWKKLDENSRDVIELLEHKDVPESNNIEENFDVEILSQEKKKYTMDLPESSDGESISSIVIPQRKLFTHKENLPPRKFPLLINNREESAKLQKSHFDHDKEIEVRPKSLFNNAKKPKTKLIFPSALLNVSTDKSVANKTEEMPTVKPKGQVRNLFGNHQGNKRKNMFADFLVSESEDEIPEIQTKVFGFQKKNEPKRKVGATSGGLQHSPTSSIVDIDMDDWIHLPSSTMVENQIEEQAATPSKRTRLSKLMETKEMDTVNNVMMCNNDSDIENDFTLEYDNNENMENNSSKSEKIGDIPNAELEGSNIERDNITNKVISADIGESKELHSLSTSKSSKFLNKSTGIDTVPMDCDNNHRPDNDGTGNDNNELSQSITEHESEQMQNEHFDDESQKHEPVSENDNESEKSQNKETIENDSQEVENDEREIQSANEDEIDIELDNHHESNIDHDNNERNEGTGNDNNELSQSITEHESEQMQNEHFDDESQKHEPVSENDNESEKSQNEETIENDIQEVENDEREIQSANEDEIDIELDNHHESNIDHDNNERNEENLANYNSETEIQNDASTKAIKTTSFRSENKKTHEARVESPETILNEKTKNLIDSFILEDRNSPRKTKSMFKQLTLRPSLAPVRESTGFSDNTGHSSANSCWDSHRITRKTLRKTFGKDFTPRKSLRTLVMEKSAKRQTFNPDLKDLSKHPHANSTELPAHDDNEYLEDDSVENSYKPMEVSSDDKREEAVQEREETIEEKEETIEEREETVEEKEGTEEEIEETVEETEETEEEAIEEREVTVEEREESVEESEESQEEREESVEEREETIEEREESIEESKESLGEREESVGEREETIEERVESMEVGEGIIEYRDHELSKRMRQTTLEMLQKIKKQELERNIRIRENIINSLKVTKDTGLFKYPNIPVRRSFVAKPVQRKAKPKVIHTRTLNDIPEEVLVDLKYKPPKRFQPRNASWATKRLYKFLETKLEPKYDYMARVRAEKLVETIYEFTKQIRRHDVAPHDAITSLKREMARLRVVDTHYEFYDFFHEYMPREVRVKVNPDPVNRIPPPRDVFANIIQ